MGDEDYLSLISDIDWKKPVDLLPDKISSLVASDSGKTRYIKSMPKTDGILDGVVDASEIREKLYRPSGKAGDVIGDDEDFGKKWLEEFIRRMKEFKCLKPVKFLTIVAGVSGVDVNPLSQNNFNSLIHRFKEYTDLVKTQYEARQRSERNQKIGGLSFNLQEPNPDALTALEIAKAQSGTAQRGVQKNAEKEPKKRKWTREPVPDMKSRLPTLGDIVLDAGLDGAPTGKAGPISYADLEDSSDYGDSDEDDGSRPEADAGGGSRSRVEGITTAGIQAVPPILQPDLFGMPSLQSAFARGKGPFLKWLMGTDNVSAQTLHLAELLYPNQEQPAEFLTTIPFISGFFETDPSVMEGIVEVKNAILKLVQNHNESIADSVEADALIDYYTEEFAIAVGSLMVLNAQKLVSLTASASAFYRKKYVAHALAIACDLLKSDRIRRKITRLQNKIRQTPDRSKLLVSEKRQRIQGLFETD